MRVTEEEDDDLALFVDIPEDDSLLGNTSDEFEAPPGSEPGTSPIFKIPDSPTLRDGKNDYDWLLTPPDTSFISLLDMEPQKCTKILNGTPKAYPTELKTKLTNWEDELPSQENCTAKQVFSPRSNSSSAGSCRPSSSGSQVSATFKSESPTARQTVPLSTKSSRHVAPTLKTTSTYSKSVAANSRSRTPTTRASTPTTRPTAPVRKPISRSGTPTRYPSTVSSASVPPGRSSSVGKLGPKITRNLAPAHGISTEKSRLQKTPEMPTFDVKKELRASMTKRPVSTSRCRSGALNSNGKLTQNSPSKELGPNRSGNHLSASRRSYSHDGDNGNHLPAVRRSYSHDGDNVNPALVGTKMVERVVNMRRLAPPKQDNQCTDNGTKKTSHDSSGFGRTLSRSSLEMAMRHMDIGRATPGNSRPKLKKVTASPVHSVKSELAKIRPTSVSDSLATSSNASSDLSLSSTPVSINLSEPEDLGSEKS